MCLCYPMECQHCKPKDTPVTCEMLGNCYKNVCNCPPKPTDQYDPAQAAQDSQKEECTCYFNNQSGTDIHGDPCPIHPKPTDQKPIWEDKFLGLINGYDENYVYYGDLKEFIKEVEKAAEERGYAEGISQGEYIALNGKRKESKL